MNADDWKMVISYVEQRLKELQKPAPDSFEGEFNAWWEKHFGCGPARNPDLESSQAVNERMKRYARNAFKELYTKHHAELMELYKGKI